MSFHRITVLLFSSSMVAGCKHPTPPEPVTLLPADSIRFEVHVRSFPQDGAFTDLNTHLRGKLTNGYADTIFLIGKGGAHFWSGLEYDSAALEIPGMRMRHAPWTLDTLPPGASVLRSAAANATAPVTNSKLGIRLYRVSGKANLSDSSVRKFLKYSDGRRVQPVFRDTV